MRTRSQAQTAMEKQVQIQSRHRRRLRQSVSLVLALLITYYLLFTTPGHPTTTDGDSATSFSSPNPGPSKGKPGLHPPGLLNNLSLTASECEAAFPGLTWSVQDVVSQGPFTLHPKTSPVLGRISSTPSSSGPKYDFSILQAQRKKDLSQEMLNSRTASLHQIHRALLTAPSSPEDLFLLSASTPDSAGGGNGHDPQRKDIVFTLNFQDQPFGTTWAYSRQADPHARPGYADGNADARTFLMPHFSFWAWKLPFVGSMWRAATAITTTSTTTTNDNDKDDGGQTFASKIPKAVWRGTTWFNSVHNPRLRANLLAVAKDKPWADVEALQWQTTTTISSSSSSPANKGGGGESGGGGERTASNSLPIEDFCRYKYVLHTEGVTYSGRFQFLQMCESVVLTPPIGWMQHTTHLVKPLFSHSLFSASEGAKTWTPSEATKRAWPRDYGPESEEANIVFVAPDWRDLEETVAWLEAHPEVAAGIARRQRETFVDGGYFSPAAETCYWRALIRGWGEVVRVDEGELADLDDGQPFEAFVLSNGD